MSMRTDIKNQIIASLSRISTAAGYNNDIALITKRLMSHEKLGGRYPALSVLTGQVNKTPDDSGVRVWQCSATFIVVGYIKADTDITDSGLLSDAADDLMEDIERALLTDSTLSHTADSKMLFYVLQTEQPYLDFENNRGEVAVILGVNFLHEEQP